MKVKYTVHWKNGTKYTETMDREIFAAWTDLKYKFEEIERLTVDVCLTRWVFNGKEWKTCPLVKYTSNGIERTTPKERMAWLAKAEPKPRFTQY